MEFITLIQVGDIGKINEYLLTHVPTITLDEVNKSPVYGYLYLMSHKINITYNGTVITPRDLLFHKYERMIKDSDTRWINCLPQAQLAVVAQFSHNNPITLEFCLSKIHTKYQYNLHPTTIACFDICVKYKYNFNKSPQYYDILVHLQLPELLERLLSWDNKRYAVSRNKLANTKTVALANKGTL